jgi:hypothetical protein
MEGVVSAVLARRCIARLRRLGMGTRQIAHLAGVGRRTIVAMVAGTRVRIRRSTLHKLQQVEPERAGGACTSAWRTRRLLENIVAEEYTSDVFIRYRIPLVVGERVRVATERRVQRVHDYLVS